MFATPKKRNVIASDEKQELINFYESDTTKMSYRQLSLVFYEKWNKIIPEQAISDIIKNKVKFMRCDSIASLGRCRIRRVEYPVLEKCLILWLSDCSAHGLPINDSMIM